MPWRKVVVTAAVPSSSNTSHHPRKQSALAFPTPSFSSPAAHEPSGSSAFLLNLQLDGQLWVVVQVEKSRAPGAKAPTYLPAFAARLKSCPFATRPNCTTTQLCAPVSPLLSLMVYLCRKGSTVEGRFWTGWRKACRSIEHASIIKIVWQKRCVWRSAP